MDFLVLTKSTTFLIGPIANVLGYIMEAIFKVCETIGIANIGLSIILFTIIVKIAMLPLSIKQQKFTKLNNVMMPELQAINKKYKGKQQDQKAMLMMQEETKAVYEKYGTSPSGSCLQLLIQMPILFALYQIIYRIPAYVSSVKALYMNIVTALQGINGYAAVEGFKDLATSNTIKEADFSNVNKLVDMMYNFDPSEWEKFKELFPSIQNIVDQNLPTINGMNNFLGINLATSPASALGSGFAENWPVLLIPILAGLTQFLSVKLMDAKNKKNNVNAAADDNNMAATMKTMNMVMPLMSVIFCFTFASVIGIYWIASSVCQVIVQICVDIYLDRTSVETLVEKNLEKVNKKRKKKGLPPKKLDLSPSATVQNLQMEQEELERRAEERLKKMQKAGQVYSGSGNHKPGSLAEKASMVQKYNETHKNK